MIDVAIMGHGVVGSGVAEILLSHFDSIAQKAKNEINIKYILDLRDFNGLSYSDKFIKDFSIISNDQSVKIVAEAMGGLHPAYEFVKECLLKGKSVVTSNKELVAAKGDELLQIANEKNVNFLFEASVGGGIPVLRPMAQCLAANEITEIYGILNGTTNFILTKMVNENMPFETALKLAQDLGYAEKNPDADILGHDACRKICILAALGFGKHVYPEQVSTEGITKISLDDVNYADILGCVIKLIGHAKKLKNGRISAAVYPALVPHSNMLSGVTDVFNAITVIGDALGEALFYGKGAGKLPTASAVVADIIDCAKHLSARKYLSWDKGYDGYVIPLCDTETKLYVHLYEVTSAIKENVFNVFGKDIKYYYNEISNEFVFITNEGIEADLRENLNKLENCKIKSVLHAIS